MIEAVLFSITSLAFGFFVGWHARTVYDKVHALYLFFKDRMDTPAGVVKPIVTRGQVPRNDPIDLTATHDPGVVMRPSPDEIIMQNMKEANRKLKI
jgi:hypothetical protein